MPKIEVSPRSVTVALALLVALGLAACSAGEPKAPARRADARGLDPAASSHERMRSLLDSIRTGSDDTNHWQGQAPAEAARARLAGLPASAPPLARWEALVAVAEHELRLGNEPEAIARLEEALEILSALGREAPPAALERNLFRLGVANLRSGETTNCTRSPSAQACILPLRRDALHHDRRGSERAMVWLGQLLEIVPASSPLQLKGVWLLNLAAMTVGQYPEGVPVPYRLPAELFASEAGFGWFENVAPERGVDTFSLFGGAVIDDFDGDDHLDLIVTTFDLDGGPRVFRGDGRGGFEDRSQSSGVGDLFGGLNLVQADYDNDGDLDLYVLRGAWLYAAGRHPNSLWRNNGHGVFTDVTFAAGLGQVHYPTQTAAWADYDNDGNVDLFVGNEHGDGRSSVGLEGAAAPLFDAPCQLFRNNGDGTFTDLAANAGVDLRAFVKGVAWGDIDNDRYPDLYVSVLGGPNHLFRNRGDGSFEDITERAGVAEPSNSFPTWFFDFDQDGALDLFVPSYRGAEDGIALYLASALGQEVPWDLPRLYRGDGKGGFRDVAREVGLDRLVLPMGSNYGDLDGDGWEDIYLGTGYPDYEALMPNVLYRNLGGRRFADVTYAAGVGHLQKGHAVAMADLDRDGDLDLFAQMGGAFPGDRYHDALFQNPGFGNRWLVVHARGSRSNRAAIGARITVEVRVADGVRTLRRVVSSGGSFGANPLRQFLGLGRAQAIERLVVFWPTTGISETFEDVPLDTEIRIVEGDGRIGLAGRVMRFTPPS